MASSVQQSGKVFVGVGFGPIQSGLFLYEAWQSKNFRRFVVAEVDEQMVRAVGANGGSYTLNIARKNRIDAVTITGVELYNPRDPAGRKALVEAIAESDELATALPSVNFFDAGGSASVAALLAEGIKARRPNHPGIIYTAENNNHAAEILSERLAQYAPAEALEQIQTLNTVIGKMSGVETVTTSGRQLASMTTDTPKAIVVEEFNRILISKITLAGFTRGIKVFEEKPDLLPFEEAKLFGHNAIHALLGYLAAERGLSTMAQVAEHPDLMQIARGAFLNECGAALIRKYGALGDALFTVEGYKPYAEDLLDRMTRATLGDAVSRVTRDPVRKLGYDDRLFGAMHLAVQYGIKPANLAKGASAAVRALLRERGQGVLTRANVESTLKDLWGAKADQYAAQLIDLTWEALNQPSAVTV